MEVQFIRHQKYSQIKIYSELTDVYAFGFIVFEIITCEKAFKNFNMFQLIKKITIEGYRPDIKEDVPQAYKKLIERMPVL